ncbi:MAG: N-acetylmuramoyl-L-alanine amidase family protein [Magnetospiraceae bacterium]
MLTGSVSANAAESCAQAAIAIDVGHTVKSWGATSARGVGEFTYNQALAQELASALNAADFTHLLLINTDGQIGSLKQRTAIANEGNAALFLSLHHDSAQEQYLKTWNVDGVERSYSDDFSGFSLFISPLNPRYADSLALATQIGTALINKGFTPTLHHGEDIPGERKVIVDRKRGIYHYDNLVVLKTAAMPAVLIEAGVIINRDEEAAIARSPDYHFLVSEAIAAGVEAYCATISLK